MVHRNALVKRTVKGSLPTRLRSAGIMAALGGVAGYPVALLHDTVAQWDAPPPGNEDAMPVPFQAAQPHDKVDVMVASMLASVGEAEKPKTTQPNPRWWWPWNKRTD